MKKIIFLSLLAIGMTGCSVESMDSEELLTADAKFKLASTCEMVFLENVCAGEETVITVNFSQRTNPQGKNLPTNIKVDLEVDGEWIDIYRANLNDVTTTSFKYTFTDATDYSLRYSAGTGQWNDVQILMVNDCNPICAYGKGYWRNHGPNNPGEQENMYPVESLDIAGTTYSQEALQAILMETGNIGDIKKMKQHLITVLLNIANGVDGANIISSIENAEEVINGNIIEKNEVNGIKDALEAFNENNGCDDYEENEGEEE